MKSFKIKERYGWNSMEFLDNVFFEYIRKEKGICKEMDYSTLESLEKKREKESVMGKSKSKNYT